MNGYEADEMEALAEALESYEADEADEWSERRRRRWPTPPRPPVGGLTQPRPQNQYVTQTQLQAALTRVEGRIKTNTEGIAKVNARVNVVSDEQGKLMAALKKETADRKKEGERLRKANAELKNTLLLTTLVPLIVKPKSIAPTTSTDFPSGTKVLVEETDFLKTLLPIGLVLFGGQLGGLLGGLEGGGSSSSSGQ